MSRVPGHRVDSIGVEPRIHVSAPATRPGTAGNSPRGAPGRVPLSAQISPKSGPGPADSRGMDTRTRRLLATSLLTIALTVLSAPPALADGDPFSQPLGNASPDTGSPPGVGGNDPFSLVGSTTSTSDPAGDPSGSPTGGDPSGTTDGYDPGEASNGSLPFTGANAETWLVAAYGLLGAGASLLIVAETFGVNRRRRALASPPPSAAARSFESYR